MGFFASISAEWITALSSVASLIIVAVSAVAALRQIEHIRIANQSSTLLTLAQLWNRAEAKPARAYVIEGNLDRFCDLNPHPDLITMQREAEKASNCLNILEIMGACIVYKIIDPAVSFGTLNAEPYWRKSERFIRLYRTIENRPSLFDKFEAMVALSQRHVEPKFPTMPDATKAAP